MTITTTTPSGAQPLIQTSLHTIKESENTLDTGKGQVTHAMQNLSPAPSTSSTSHFVNDLISLGEDKIELNTSQEITHAAPTADNAAPTALTPEQRKFLQQAIATVIRHHHGPRDVFDSAFESPKDVEKFTGGSRPTDMAKHRGKLTSETAGSFLKNVNQILGGQPLADARKIENSEIVNILKSLFAAIPDLNSNRSNARKDDKILATNVAHQIVKKAISKEQFSSDHANTLGAAAADLAMALNDDTAKRGHRFRKEYKHSVGDQFSALARVVNSPLNKEQRKKYDLSIVTLPALPLAAAGGLVEAGLRMTAEDKPVNHAIRLLRLIINQIPRGQIRNDLFEKCVKVLKQAPSDGATMGEPATAEYEQSLLSAPKASYRRDQLHGDLKRLARTGQAETLSGISQKETLKGRLYNTFKLSTPASLFHG